MTRVSRKSSRPEDGVIFVEIQLRLSLARLTSTDEVIFAESGISVRDCILLADGIEFR
jgi:hypothetical protein